jgi:chromosome segregation protein
MIQFSKLRLNGFKSFVDKTELDIGPGLTGIVGPNGCGKSNLVEALRWVMGENSAKRMRGSGSMEDVIFNGTSARPQRNFAEVGLLLNNASRSAPAAYNGEDEIEVTRRIERDQGSLYKINGKTQRARDVQMLFADTVTGANSPALVSQGRVTAMINAKPQERRLILEESAGISGLYARRHEAELRLRAADNNLQRLQDLTGSMEARFGALKKQARQAVRYRELSAEIRQVEVTVACLEWKLLSNRIEAARARFGEAESRVAEHMVTVSQLSQTQNVQSEDLPELRRAEAEAAAALQANKLALQRLDDQERDLQNQLDEARQQLEQLTADREHEKQSLGDSSTILERLESEEKSLIENRKNEDTMLAEKKGIKARLEEKVLKLEEDYEAFMGKVAESKASRQALEKQVAADESRLLVAQERQEALTEDLERARSRFDEDSKLDQLKHDIVSLEAEVNEGRAAFEAAQATLNNARETVETTRTVAQDTEKKKSGAETEINTLKSVLQSDSQDSFKPILDDIQTEKGFETALSRALGDTLMASTDGQAPVIWLERDYNESDFPALPAGVARLEPHIKAPRHLKASLSLIGVVDDSADGARAANALKPGQSIVSRDGAYWRWDGLHIKPEASDRHALALQQKNRLKDLERELPALISAAAQAAQAFEAAKQTRDDAQEKVESLQSSTRESERNLTMRQNELNRATEERSGLFAEIAKLEEALSRCAEDIVTYTASIADNAKALEAYDERTQETQNEEIEKLRGRLVEARDGLREAVRELDSLEQEQSRRMARLHAIADERVNLQNRSIRSRERIKELDERETQLTEKLESLENRPQTITNDREVLLDKISTLENARNAAADRLAVVENELGDTNKALKEAENLLTEAREARAGAQATVTAGEEQLAEMLSSIEEHFSATPQALAAEAKLDLNAESLPAIEPLKAEKEKMIRSRDMIGPVNLRAEVEATELEKELSGILSERNDLIQAIEELREGINKLNKEARERLSAAFDHVNGHFQQLFVKLYGGGSAHLKLIESDDPLEAGLEIFAQPPGKTLQSLSLLSGGEQTLASIALIFAMFLTNPSPICVLDEIDAPLDDANVDRVCDLLDEIAARGETRFLIITHHRLTMARMDRLYGVTMAERGVSQLVSVDLNKQMDFLEAAE